MAGQDDAVAPDALINRDDGRKYWADLAADEDAMLGGIPSVEGFSNISRIDLQGSRTFLARFGIGNKQGRRAVSSALEGGAGYVSIHPTLDATIFGCSACRFWLLCLRLRVV